MYHADPKFLLLGDGFADPVESASFPQKILRFRNDRAAAEVGLDTLSDKDWVRHFADFEPLPDNLKQPLAQRYHGHQFRSYNPMIGDGRGFLFAQLRDKKGRLMDLGTKGSGNTPYSRSGDGRLTLKGAFREVLASEMLEALGTNTSRTFSIIETGEELFRSDEPSPTRSAVLTRLTHGHIRIGTFQRHAYHSDHKRLLKLVDFCLEYYFGERPTGSEQDRILLFLSHVCPRVATQAADLMSSGFVHGVLNTDNINITGEIFDFGPWRFLPKLDFNFTAAYFDETGLYAYGRQAEAIQWNLYQLGGTFLELVEEKELRDSLEPFGIHFETALKTKLYSKLGVKQPDGQALEDGLKLINHFLASNDIGFEQFFFDWYGGVLSKDRAFTSPFASLYNDETNNDLIKFLQTLEPIKHNILDNDYFTGKYPCTMLIDEVEAIWKQIAEQDDWSAFTQKLDRIQAMAGALSTSR